MRTPFQLRPRRAIVSAFFILAAATAYADLPSVVPDQGLFTPNYSQVRAPVVVQGDIALLGVPGESGHPSGTMGYVEVWRRVQSENCVQQSCWVRAERLPEPPGLQPDSFFGASIAFDGKTALIGAPSELDGQEAVYVYALERRGWVLKQTLRSGATEPTNFGRFLALDGNSERVIADDGHTQVVALGHELLEEIRLWPKVVKLYGGYEDYQRSTEREIPIVILDRR